MGSTTIHTGQLALLLVAFFRIEGNHAFAPPLTRTRTASRLNRENTRRHVGSTSSEKWQLTLQSDEHKVKTRNRSSSVLEDPLAAIFLPHSGPIDGIEEGPKSVEESNQGPFKLLAAAAVALVLGAAVLRGFPTDELTNTVQSFVQDPTAVLERVTDLVADMGPLGPVYFGCMYTIAEVLAIPAVPLTASAGYLFGVGTGTLVVLVSASLAASISFFIGRSLLRTTVETVILQKYPQFAKLDRVIGREGFQLMLLLRLSPLMPFALSNYLYGATSIDFASFFWATLLGFAPGTLAYVYTGVVGKALTIGGDNAQPWYIYAGGAVLLGGLLKLLVDVAGNIIAEIQEEAES